MNKKPNASKCGETEWYYMTVYYAMNKYIDYKEFINGVTLIIMQIMVILSDANTLW